MRRSITFYSEGFKLDGDLFLLDDLRSGDRRGGIVLAHGYTGVKPAFSQVMAPTVAWRAVHAGLQR